MIDTRTIALLKTFVQCDWALLTLSVPSFLSITSVPIPCIQTFRYTIIPESLEKLNNIIKKKLANAVAIWLLADAWTSKSRKDFLAIGAAMTDENFNREILIIDVVRLEASHTTDYIQAIIEKTIAKFDIPRQHIHGITTDQGSNMPGAYRSAWIVALEEKEYQDSFDMNKITEELKKIGGQPDVLLDSTGNLK